jgi:hypothetical protein
MLRTNHHREKRFSRKDDFCGIRGEDMKKISIVKDLNKFDREHIDGAVQDPIIT